MRVTNLPPPVPRKTNLVIRGPYHGPPLIICPGLTSAADFDATDDDFRSKGYKYRRFMGLLESPSQRDRQGAYAPVKAPFNNDTEEER